SARKSVSADAIPRLAAVVGLPERAAGAAAVVAASAAAALIARRVQHARIRWIHDYVCKSSVLVDVLDLRPRLAAVRRLVDAAVRARAEQMAGRGDVDDVRILRIDHDARDGLRLLEPDVRERLAAVFALVDPVAEGRRLPIVRFTRPDIHDVRVR